MRRRAAANHRSLQRELLSILEAAVGRGSSRATTSSVPARAAITIDELAEISHKLFPNGTESSVAFIRQMRDSR